MNHDFKSQSRYVGVYPRGFSCEACAELNLIGASVQIHYEVHCAIVFMLAESPSTAYQELGTFSFIFELIGEPICLGQQPTREHLQTKASAEIVQYRDAWRSTLTGFEACCFNVHRAGNHAFSIASMVSDLIDTLTDPSVEAMKRRKATSAGAKRDVSGDVRPFVDSRDYDVEIMVYHSDGFDNLRAQADHKWSRAASRNAGITEVLFIGTRSAQTKARSAQLWLKGERHSQKKENMLRKRERELKSEANDAVSICVAYKAMSLLADGRSEKVLRVLDPTCGRGTLLLAMRWIHTHRPMFKARVSALELIGFEIKPSKTFWAQFNANSAFHCKTAQIQQRIPVAPISFVCASSDAIPLASSSMDLIVVDPPWGMQGNNHEYVKRKLPRWIQEWTRVLCTGGVALIITVTKGLVEKALSDLRLQSGELAVSSLLEVKEIAAFDNKGWSQCSMFVAVKVDA